ncbi:MAG: LysR family transcriptional regulator [Edaphobacter sp.]
MFSHVSTAALVCAVVLSEEGDLGRTAEPLHTSNTNGGKKVKILQEGWGIVFFRRTMTGFELTEEGRSAMRESLRTVREFE